MGRPSKFTPEFRRDAVELIRSPGRSIAEVARSLGVNDGTLGNWVKANREARERAADPEALSESEREELKRLRRPVTEREMGRRIVTAGPCDRTAGRLSDFLCVKRGLFADEWGE